MSSIQPQLAVARDVIERHLHDDIIAIHLFGSAVEGGLRPLSDIDLLVTVRQGPPEAARRALMQELLGESAPPGTGDLRALEVTVLALPAIKPWRHPARRELQFGEWLRGPIAAGEYEPPLLDHDIAILLTQARARSVALQGPEAVELFDEIPPDDFRQALRDTVAQWESPADWRGDERNIVLALARIWYSAATGGIAAKDVAASWALDRLPAELRGVMSGAREAYLSGRVEAFAAGTEEIEKLVLMAKAAIGTLLGR